MTSAVKTNAKKKAPQAAAEKPKGGGLGLDGLGDLSSLLDEPQAAPQVGASQLPNRGAVAAGKWVPSAEEGPQAK